MTSKKTYKELENEKTRGKRKYQERLIEEAEAEQLIKEYEQEQQEETETDNIIYKP